MNQGTQGYSLTKKTEGRKSRDTVSLSPLPEPNQVKAQAPTTQKRCRSSCAILKENDYITINTLTNKYLER
jgi:hypothetical protein